MWLIKTEMSHCVIFSGAFMKMVTPKSILAESPAFTNTVDEAESECGDWIAKCRTCQKSAIDKASSGLLGIC